MKPLSLRQQSILNRIVETHIDTAQPVSSRFITSLYTDLYRGSYSPATVRAEMGTLEALGYLTHPHTSAGRLPTDLGYRYYVDHGLQEEEKPADLASIHRELQDAGEEEETRAEKISCLLSSFSDEASLVVLSNASGKKRYRVFVEGSSRMLEKPEFQDAHKARPVFKAFEEKNSLSEWLLGRPGNERQVTVTIGSENHSEAFRHCAVISSTCRLNENCAAAVAVVGPRRMRYSQAVPLVAYMGRLIQNFLESEVR